MKYLLIVLTLALALSCKDENKQNKTENTTTETTENATTKSTEKKAVKNTSASNIPFLKNVKRLEEDTSANPIDTFKALASTAAKEIIKINENNIKDVLAKAKGFNHVVITVEDHTIVKIIDLNDCKPSGSWSACMPKAEGYIKKGDLMYNNDYINNIIGLPDNQERLLYLF